MERPLRHLTPRERDVLDLVRLGLTNDQIADRLGITSNGVKYHISQVLSKLGVSSRHEAVNAAYGDSRRRWRAAAFASRLARAAGAATVLAALVGVALLLWGVLRSDEQANSPDVSGLTPADVYASVEKAATRPGQVLHSQIEATVEMDGETVPYFTTELWTDPASESVRSEYHLAPEQDSYDLATEATVIIVGRYVYYPDDPGEALRDEITDIPCGNSDTAWMSTLLLCGAGLNSPTSHGFDDPRVEAGEFRGRDAVILRFEASESIPFSDPEEPFTTPRPPDATPRPAGETRTLAYISRVYLGADDYLPIAYTMAQSIDGDSPSVAVEAVYRNEFLPLGDAVRTLLDPKGIGYGIEDAGPLLDEIERDVPVYWFGEEFADESVGEMVLTQITGRTLIYEAPDGYPQITLRLWPPADWQEFLTSDEGRIISRDDCSQRVDSDVSGEPATIYVLPPIEFPGVSTPDPNESDCNYRRRLIGLVDTMIGAVTFEGVVADVRADTYLDSPAQMQSLLQALQPR